MITLIGGPPKCGKTTLAKRISKKHGIPWISTDTLQVVTREYVRKYSSQAEIDKLYPHSVSRGENNDANYAQNTPRQIAKKYLKQTKSCHLAIDMFAITEIKDGNDFVVEGYHITPQLVSRLVKKYGKSKIRAVFLVKSDVKKFVDNIHNSSTPNDWIIHRTLNPDKTYPKIAQMISIFGELIEQEAKKYRMKVFKMDHDFKDQLKKAMNYLKKA